MEVRTLGFPGHQFEREFECEKIFFEHYFELHLQFVFFIFHPLLQSNFDRFKRDSRAFKIVISDEKFSEFTQKIVQSSAHARISQTPGIMLR